MDSTAPQLPARPERYEQIARWLTRVGFSLPPLCFLIYFSVFFLWRHETLGGTDVWGQFGEFVSGVAGTFLAAATLVALAWTLGLQAKELQASRELAQKQALTLQSQSEAMHQQAFESTFFQILQRFTDIANDLRARGTFRDVPQHLERKIQGIIGRPQTPEQAYKSFYSEWQGWLGPYFRTFFHVIKFVDASVLSETKKADYTSLARAQLGSDELFLQFVNAALGEEGRTGMQPLIAKYGLLKHAKNVEFPAPFQAIKFTAIPMSSYLSRAEREAAAE